MIEKYRGADNITIYAFGSMMKKTTKAIEIIMLMPSKAISHLVFIFVLKFE
jgi:phage terminase large subunit-like protein